MKRICVFCGSNPGRRAAYREAAVAIGHLLAERNIELVYGGANVGLMGIVANSVLEKRGVVTGVIPEVLVAQELAHRGIQNLRVVGSMHERKALMADLSDGFIALPGGFGTFEEFCEVLTWSQLGLHRKPCGLLNLHGYFDNLLKLFDQAVEERFLRPEHRAMVLDHEDPSALIERLLVYKHPEIKKWISG